MLAGASAAELDDEAARPLKITGAREAGSTRAPADPGEVRTGGEGATARTGRRRGAKRERAVTGAGAAAAGAEYPQTRLKPLGGLTSLPLQQRNQWVGVLTGGRKQTQTKAVLEEGLGASVDPSGEPVGEPLRSRTQREVQNKVQINWRRYRRQVHGRGFDLSRFTTTAVLPEPRD